MLSILIRAGVVLLAVAPLDLSAQPENVQARMAELLRYTGIENPTEPDVARMADLWTRAQRTDLAREERRLAFRDMYLIYARLHGRDLTNRVEAREC